MKHIPYFNLYPADFMNGVRGMSAQEVGVYMMLLCRIYEENGPIENNTIRLSTYCGMRLATFEIVLSKLIALGKITEANGMLFNDRAEGEISKRADGLKNNSKAGKASAEKRQQKQQMDATGVGRVFNHTDTDTDTDKKDTAALREGVEIEPQGFRGNLLEAMGVDPVSGLTGRGGQMIGTQADMATAARWLAMPAMTEAAIVAEVRRKASQMKAKPGSFSYFTGAMQDLSAALSAPPLEASQIQRPMGNRNAERHHAGTAINELARLVGAGEISFPANDIDPFAPRH